MYVLPPIIIIFYISGISIIISMKILYFNYIDLLVYNYIILGSHINLKRILLVIVKWSDLTSILSELYFLTLDKPNF